MYYDSNDIQFSIWSVSKFTSMADELELSFYQTLNIPKIWYRKSYLLQIINQGTTTQATFSIMVHFILRYNFETSVLKHSGFNTILKPYMTYIYIFVSNFEIFVVNYKK